MHAKTIAAASAASFLVLVSVVGAASATTCLGSAAEPVRACAGGLEEGSGSCATGAPFYYAENAATAEVRQGTTTHHAYASHFCYAFLVGPYSGSGAGLTAGTYSYDSASGAYSGAGAFWTGFVYSNPGGSGGGCFTNVFTNNQPVVGHNNVPLGCPAGPPPGPPVVLP